jgi:hypothetical protein
VRIFGDRLRRAAFAHADQHNAIAHRHHITALDAHIPGDLL